MATTPAAGELNRRITFQARAPGRDSVGQPNGAWADAFTVWVKEEPLKGGLWFAAAQEQSNVTTRFTVRYRPDILPAMRLRNSLGQVFDIVGDPINLDGANAWLQIMAATGVRDAR